MKPDEFQQAWRAQSSETRITIDADLLSQEVQRSHQTFRSTIFRRDLREVGVALALIPVWFVLGKMGPPVPWTWYLTVPVLVWVAGFILVDRLRYPQLPVEPGDTLLNTVEKSLTQVEHQIWLLRNIFWWYLLPPSISIMAFFIHCSWLKAESVWELVISALSSGLILLVVFGFLYYVNQRAVRKELQPRREELLNLRASLQDEGDQPDEHPDASE